jgi:hypothetical protein
MYAGRLFSRPAARSPVREASARRTTRRRAGPAIGSAGVVGGWGGGGLGGELGVRVDVVEREVTPHVPDVAVAGEQFPQDGLGMVQVRKAQPGSRTRRRAR